MSNRVLKFYIESFKNQKTEVFPLLLSHYKQLIHYYAARLKCEDGFQELTLFFIELLFSIDTEKFVSDNSTSLARYISISIKHKYIEISKRIARYEKLHMPFFENCFETVNETQFRLEIEEILKFLSEKQRKVIIFKYFHDYSDAEIGEFLGISRQSVFRLKNRALKTIRQFYIE